MPMKYSPSRLLTGCCLFFALACSSNNKPNKELTTSDLGETTTGTDSAGSGGTSTEQGGCTQSSECPQGALCREGECLIPTTCLEGGECGSEQVCDTTTNTCVQCLTGKDCEKGQTCLAQICRDGCESTADCDGGLSCSPSGFCVECSRDVECSPDEHCSAGACQADTCAARTSWCGAQGDVVVCSERGDSTLNLACPEGESCGGAPAWCTSWVCVPNQNTCSEAGHSELCAADGLSYASSIDCAADDSVCVEGLCEPLVCDAYGQFCQDGDVYACNATGTASSVKTTCALGQYCDESSASCKAKVCVPGEKSCDGGQVATCNALGSGYENHEACDSSEVCKDALCQPIICEPSRRFCQAGDVYSCDSFGASAALYDDCLESEYCNDGLAQAVCATDLCSAGQPTCEGNAVGTCNEDGSAVVEQTQDCEVTGQACYLGACEDVVCDQARLCVDGDVHSCTNNGTATQIYESCGGDEYCDAETATCQPQICTPNLLGCDGEIVRTCNADGSGWGVDGTDCSTSGTQTCLNGLCADIICTPGQRYCDGTQVKTCNTKGTAGSVYQSCSSRYHCYESETVTAYCRYDLCTAGAAMCDGNRATQCASDGSGLLPGGTDCTETGQVCYAGACKDQVCTGNYTCVDGNHHYCNQNGTSTSLRQTCSSSQYCDDSLGCRPQVCTPDAPMCYGDVVTTCKSDGSGPVAGGTDCVQSGQACFEAECKPIVCVIGLDRCEGNDVRFCEDNGTRVETFACGESAYCEYGSCIPL